MSHSCEAAVGKVSGGGGGGHETLRLQYPLLPPLERYIRGYQMRSQTQMLRIFWKDAQKELRRPREECCAARERADVHLSPMTRVLRSEPHCLHIQSTFGASNCAPIGPIYGCGRVKCWHRRLLKLFEISAVSPPTRLSLSWTVQCCDSPRV